MGVTPVLSPQPNLRVKLEMFNRGGSHKSRAARHVIEQAIAEGHLTPGGPRRILEKSGGNFGIGLAYEAAKHEIGVDLVIGLNFSPLKRALCEEFGARLVGTRRLRDGLQPKEVIAELLSAEGPRYHYTDQFSNQANLHAHLVETGPEFLAQIAPDLARHAGCILVVAAGTGASACGVGTVLRGTGGAFQLVLNEPESCDYRAGLFRGHVQQGTAVGICPPFLDLRMVDRIIKVSDAQAREGQRRFARDCGIYPGPSSGANYLLACHLAEQHPDQLVLTLMYDSGEGYLDNPHNV